MVQAQSEVVPGIGAIEGFIAERKIGDDVALDDRLQQWPLKPGRVAQAAALDGAVSVEANPGQDVAAKALDQSEALARLMNARHLNPNFPRRRAVEDLIDQPEALLDFADADPNSRIHITFGEGWSLKAELIVRRISEIAPGVERTSGGASG